MACRLISSAQNGHKRVPRCFAVFSVGGSGAEKPTMIKAIGPSSRPNSSHFPPPRFLLAATKAVPKAMTSQPKNHIQASSPSIRVTPTFCRTYSPSRQFPPQRSPPWSRFGLYARRGVLMLCIKHQFDNTVNMCGSLAFPPTAAVRAARQQDHVVNLRPAVIAAKQHSIGVKQVRHHGSYAFAVPYDHQIGKNADQVIARTIRQVSDSDASAKRPK